MTVKINRRLCDGCGNAKETRCMTVCPGDLLYKDSSNRCALRDPGECWDCAACVKECPRQALAMFLPVQIGGRGSTLTARTEKNRLIWTLTKPDGNTEEFIIHVRNDK